MAQIMRRLIFALLLTFTTSIARGNTSFATSSKKSIDDSLLPISIGQQSNNKFSDNHVFSKRNISESTVPVEIPSLYKNMHQGKHYSSNISAAVCESECGENEKCVIVDGQSTCICTENFARRNSKGKCEECDCGGDGHICSLNSLGVKMCQCKHRYIYDEKITQKCIVDCDSCGINEVCSLENDEINCFCRDLYVRNNASADCELCYCGEGTKSCEFDEKGQPVCTCTDEFAYEKKRRKCLLPDCASCERNEACSLENGEISCFCKELYAKKKANDECEPCSCGEGSASCSFNSKNLPSCSCKAKYKSVYVDGKYECRLDCSSCGKNEVCSLVNDEIICSCQELYAKKNESGECESCTCGRDRTESCEFNEEGQRVCACKQKYAFYTQTRECLSCDCGPNGKCYVYGSPYSIQKSCSCNKGYEERNTFCYRCDCGPFGTCNFDSRDMKTCKCKKGYKLENVREEKCLLCDCGQYGECSFIKGEKHCRCQKGYEVNTHKEYKCRPCDCGPGGSCEYIRGNKFCTCKTGYVLINSEMCEDCMCGYNSVGCYFKDRRKVCSCRPGYIDINGTCGECDCGGNDHECSLTSEGEKQCHCKEGFVYDDRRGQKCIECDCGGFGNLCNFTDNGDKECQCKEGYIYNERRHKCIECDCGGNDHVCHFNSQEGKWCQCKEGYSYDEGTSQICRECSCGPNSTKCFLQNEMKLCVCNPGYQVANGICQECDCGGSDHACSFSSQGEKQCQCTEGYAYDEGRDNKCVECRCGVNSTSCYFKNERKLCICNPGYQDEKGTCQIIEVSSTDDNIEYSTPFTTKPTTQVIEISSTDENTELSTPVTTMPTTQAFTTSKITESPTTSSIGSTSPVLGCDCGPFGNCTLNSGGKICKCEKGYSWDRNGRDICEECNCGEFGICNLHQGRKFCQCEDGHVWERHESGICKKCDCGFGGYCHFRYGKRVCECRSGYALDYIDNQEVCSPCDCGRNGVCELSGKKKICMCDTGFVWDGSHSGKCERFPECDCGEYGRCVLDKNGRKHCTCVQGYEIHNGKCRECDCGSSGKCFLNTYGDKMCICSRGYKERHGRCLPKEYWFELSFDAFTIAVITGGIVAVNILISCYALRRSPKD